MLDLIAEIELEPGAPAMPDGRRGIADFGEVWSPADAALMWPPGSDVPIGEPLVYECEVRWASEEVPRRATPSLWAINDPRGVMRPGAEFVLQDGHTPRPTGRVLAWR